MSESTKEVVKVKKAEELEGNFAVATTAAATGSTLLSVFIMDTLDVFPLISIMGSLSVGGIAVVTSVILGFNILDRKQAKATKKILGLPNNGKLRLPTHDTYWEKDRNGTRQILFPSLASPSSEVYRANTRELALLAPKPKYLVWDENLEAIEKTYSL